MIKTASGERDLKATTDRLLRNLRLLGAEVRGLEDIEYPERRELLSIRYQGAPYEVHVRVSHGQVLVFSGFGNAAGGFSYPVTKRQDGKVHARKVLDQIIGQGPVRAWVEEQAARKEALDRVKAQDKKNRAAIARVRLGVGKAITGTPLEGRVSLHNVTPAGEVDSITITGPWKKADLMALLKRLGDG